jgi:hypothetical protein
MKRGRFDYDDLLPYPLKTIPHPKGAIRVYEKGTIRICFFARTAFPF